MRIIEADSLDVLEIARVGEQEATQVRFSTAWWYQTFGAGGSFALEVERPGDTAPYLVPLTDLGSAVAWTVSAADAALLGRGSCQLRYDLGGTLAKTRIWTTRILASLSEPGEAPPDPWESYVDEIHGYQIAAEDAAERAAGSAEGAADSARDAASSADVALDSSIAAGLSEQNALHSERAAAESERSSADSAAAAAISAHDAQLALQGMVYVTFAMDADGHVIIRNGDLLGTTSFELIGVSAAQSAGHLEVSY